MSESQDPLDANEVARLRALVSDYETKLTDAASLMARVRHEINNPLAALLGQAQLLLRDELSEKVRRRAETIESQAKRIEEITANCVTFSFPSPRRTGSRNNALKPDRTAELPPDRELRFSIRFPG